MNHKRGLDVKVAHLLGIPEKKVGDITSEFFNQLSLFLGEEGGANACKDSVLELYLLKCILLL